MVDDESTAFAASVKDRYRVEHELGRGGWGVVYAAHDLRLDRSVAIKLLRREYAGSLSSDRFRQEIGILSRLDHPNIVSLYDSGEFMHAPWYAMSLVQGETLRTRLDRDKQLAIPEALRIARAVAEALVHAHAAGVVHRDIKPANILLSGERVRVVDFGVARALTNAATPSFVTSTGVQIGTPSYMSPEQASGRGDVDRRSDIYSLGCVLYEMLAGEPPFLGASPLVVIARQMLDPVPSLQTVRGSVPELLEQTVYKALAKSPADRFQQANDLIAALDLAGREPEVSVSRERRAPTRGKRPLIAGLVLVAVGVGGWSGWTIIERNADARALAQADTSKLALFPATRVSATQGELPDVDARIRRAVSGWSGLAVVNVTDMATTDAVSEPIPLTRARARSLEDEAGRFLRVSYGVARDSLRVHLELFDVHNLTSALNTADELAPSQAEYDTAIRRAIARLLVRDTYTVTESPPGTSRSLPAEQAFAAGWKHISEWNLTEAESSFSRARTFDPAHARASLWLAQTRQWRELQSPNWLFAAEAAEQNQSQLTDGERIRVAALIAWGKNDRARACDAFRTLVTRDSADFTAWYAAGNCLARDRIVVRAAPGSGQWQFRTGYHTALAYYRRAFELNPAVLRSLQAGAFERGRRMFKTSGKDTRIGLAAPPDTGTFVAYPALIDDTLAFVPLRASVMAGADASSMRRMPTNVGEAVERQRRLFLEVTTTWRAADSQDPSAGEAVAVALSLLDDASALDTIVKVRRLVTDPERQLRLMSAQVWMALQFGVNGTNPGLLKQARALADSVLAMAGPQSDNSMFASIAALTGHVALTRRLNSTAPSQQHMSTADRIAESLVIFSAFGGPTDSLASLDRSVRRGAAVKPQEGLSDVNGVVLMRAASLAFPHYRMSYLNEIAGTNDYLITAELAFARGDTATVRQSLERLKKSRAAFALPEITFDALYPEAWLVSQLGDKRSAAAWLDPALNNIRVQASVTDPINAASLVQTMALRAELAAAQKDNREAERWARAVVTLWSNADPFLLPVVDRMRQLARS